MQNRNVIIVITVNTIRYAPARRIRRRILYTGLRYWRKFSGAARCVVIWCLSVNLFLCPHQKLATRNEDFERRLQHTQYNASPSFQIALPVLSFNSMAHIPITKSPAPLQIPNLRSNASLYSIWPTSLTHAILQSRHSFVFSVRNSFTSSPSDSMPCGV